MDLFGISPLNILVILGVMLIVFGPERLPEMAAKAGKFMRDLRSYASDVTGEFGGEFAEIQQHFTGVQEQMRDFGSELQQTAAGMHATVRDAASNADDSMPSIPSLNEPLSPDKVVPMTSAPIRPRVDDYKPS